MTDVSQRSLVVLYLADLGPNRHILLVAEEEAVHFYLATYLVSFVGNEYDITASIKVDVLVASGSRRVGDVLRRPFRRFIFVHRRRHPVGCMQVANVPEVHSSTYHVPEIVGDNVVGVQDIAVRHVLRLVVYAHGAQNEEIAPLPLGSRWL